MKNTSFLLVLSVFFGFISIARSQNTDIKLGPMFMPGISANAGSVANGTKTDAVDFSWAAGVCSRFPRFNPNIGLQFGLAYDNRTVGFHDQATADSFDRTYTFSYFSACVRNSASEIFLSGLGIRVPVSA